MAVPANERMKKYRENKLNNEYERISFFLKKETAEKIRKFMKKRNLVTYDSFANYITDGNYAKEFAHHVEYMETNEDEIKQMKEHGEFPIIVKKNNKIYREIGNDIWTILKFFENEEGEKEYLNIETFT